MNKTVIGLFENRDDVENLIAQIRDEGFDAQDISIVMQDQKEATDIRDNTGATVADNTTGGAVTGAVVGGIAGLLAAAVIPGIGALFIAGPLATTLGLTGAAATTASGAVTGAIAGGFIGALMGLGLSRDEAEVYQTRIQEGLILVAVSATPREAVMLEDVFEQYNATDVRSLTNGDMTEEVTEHPSSHAHFAYTTKGGRTRRKAN